MGLTSWEYYPNKDWKAAIGSPMEALDNVKFAEYSEDLLRQLIKIANTVGLHKLARLLSDAKAEASHWAGKDTSRNK